MYCGACGTEIPPDEAFCPQCGAKVTGIQSLNDTLQPSLPSTSTSVEKRLDQIIEQNKVLIDAQQSRGIIIRDFNMPFVSLVGLMVKIALASIPALIFLAILGFMLSALFVAVLAAF